jgi:hypothetical protein
MFFVQSLYRDMSPFIRNLSSKFTKKDVPILRRRGGPPLQGYDSNYIK